MSAADPISCGQAEQRGGSVNTMHRRAQVARCCGWHKATAELLTLTTAQRGGCSVWIPLSRSCNRERPRANRVFPVHLYGCAMSTWSGAGREHIHAGRIITHHHVSPNGGPC